MMRMCIIGILLAATLAGADVKYDGAKVHYESYGKGPEAVVFIHGHKRAAAERSCAIFRHDDPGHGRMRRDIARQ